MVSSKPPGPLQQFLCPLQKINSCLGTSQMALLFSRTTWVGRYQKGKTSLHLNEARDDGVLGCSRPSISWTILKQSAPRSRLITTPTPHHAIFTGRMLFVTPNQQCESDKRHDSLSGQVQLSPLQQAKACCNGLSCTCPDREYYVHVHRESKNKTPNSWP